MKKIIILVSSLVTFLVLGQTNDQKYSQYYFKNTPQAPSVASFLRYGDLQNSEYTGANSPIIPLYIVTSGNIKIPLDLKYISGNGIRVTDESGSLGLGWDLNLPSITQSVLGYDDLDMGIDKMRLDFIYPSPFDGYLPSNCTTYINTEVPGLGKYSYYKSRASFLPFKGRFAQYQGNTEIAIDGSPDIYSLNLFGEKIVFTISNFPTASGGGATCILTGGITKSFIPIFVVLNKKGYKIEYENNSFIITDLSGVKYFFTQSEEIRNGVTVNNRNYVLNQIKDTNNNSIFFQYKSTGTVNNLSYYSRNLNYSYAYGFGETYLPLAIVNQPMYSQEFDFIYYNGAGSGANINPLFTNNTNGYTQTAGLLFGTNQNYLNIEKIYGDFGSIDFSYSSREDHPSFKLDKIEIKNQYSIIKNINFSYDYFIAENISKVINSNYDQVVGNYFNNLPMGRVNKKLKLLALQIDDANYSFSYFNTSISPKNSFAQDYWGYPNGAYNNNSLFPNPQDFSYPITLPVLAGVNDNIKTANEEFVKAGLLEKIFYPTKGYSLFKYELNEADNLFNSLDNSTIIKGKGVRLKEQLNYDTNGFLESRDLFTYFLGRDTNPLFLFHRNKYSVLDVYPSNYKGYASNYSIVNTNAQNTNSASPLSSGNYVGYSKVSKKKISNSSLEENGEIITEYTNGNDTFYQNEVNRVPLSMPSTQGNGEINGLISKQFIYDKNHQLLVKTENSYNNYSYNLQYGSSLSLGSRYVVNTNQNNGGQPMEVFTHNVSLIGYFPIFYKESLIDSSKKTEYINNQEFTTNSNQFYNINNLVTYKSITYPDGKYNWESFNYSTEKNNTKLISANILNIPLEVKKVGNVINGSSKITSLVETKYEDINHLNPTSVLSYNLSDLNANPSIEVTYDRYDFKGNLEQYTTKEGIPVSIIWGYNKTKPIARVEGTTYNQIESLTSAIIAASDMDAFDPSQESLLISALNNFRSNLSNYQITTYTYDPLVGVKSITPPSGIREVYIYDSANRLKEVREDSASGKILKEYQYNYKH